MNPAVFGPIPYGRATLVPGTGLRVTQYGPDMPWKLELVLDDGRLLRDFTLPPAFSIDQRQTMYCYSNRGHPNFHDLLYRLIEFDVKLEWDPDGQATVTAVDNTDRAAV